MFDVLRSADGLRRKHIARSFNGHNRRNEACLRNNKRVSTAANAVVGCLIGRWVFADGTQDRTVRTGQITGKHIYAYIEDEEQRREAKRFSPKCHIIF